MKLRAGIGALLVLFLLAPALVAAETAAGIVTRVYDGDTVEVAGIGRIRLLGIDTPEHEASERDRFYLRWQIPPAKLRSIAREARRLNRQLAEGESVTLEYRPGDVDPYGRRLAYLFLPDGRMLNLLLLQKGLATTFRRYDFERKREFLAAEEHARTAGIGLWE